MTNPAAKAHVCPNVERCELFPRFRLKATLAVFMTNYCHDDFARCARFELAVAGTRPPPSLLPNGRSLDIVE